MEGVPKIVESGVIEDLDKRAAHLTKFASELEGGLDFSIYLHMKVLGMSDNELLTLIKERVEFVRGAIDEGA